MEERTAVKRRGILAAAGAVVAGLMASKTGQPVAADNGTWSFPYTGTVSDPSTWAFSVTNTGTAGVGIHGSGIDNGVAGDGRIGVFGVSGDADSALLTGSIGVGGQCFLSNGTGVYGYASSSGGTGVIGTNTQGRGIYGVSGGDNGVYGNTNAPANSGKAGVGGIGNGTGTYGVIGFGAGGVGVQGQSTTTGVVGQQNATSGAGQGVYAQTSSPGGFGIVGQNTAPGGTGLLGYCAVASSGAIAFAGSAGPGNYAAYFNGTVVVNGQLVVSNPSYKSGVLKHSGDGSDRLVYCMESPESWIEDFGEGKLINGTADVKLDPDFAAVVQTDSYRIFLMPEGDCNGLFVTNKNAKGFTVQEQQGGASSLTFGYRVVAKPKVGAGVTLNRLEKFTMPKGPTIDPASFPKAEPVEGAKTVPVDTTAKPMPSQSPSPAPAPRPPAAASASAVAPAVATVPPAKVDAPAPVPPSRP